jgi:hypothetical protein
MQAEKDSPDLIPRYVLGFVDNYPRPGEDIFKTEGDVNDWAQVSLGEIYEEGDIGPDGLNLQLVTECEEIEVNEDDTSYTDSYQAGATILWRENLEIVNGGPWGNVCWDEYRSLWYDIFKVYSYSYTNRYYYLIPIGPKLYLMRVSASESWKIDEEHQWVHGEPNYMGYYCTVPCTIADGNCEAIRQQLEASALATQQEPDPVPDGSFYNTDHNYMVRVSIAVALYNEENLEIARSIGSYEGSWPPSPFDVVPMSSAWRGLFASLEQRTVDLTVSRRPHTKEELVEAGLLNEDGSLPEVPE